MKTATMKSRLAKANLITKNGRINGHYYYNVMRLMAHPDEDAKLYLCKWVQAKGRFTLVDTDYRHTIELLNALKLNYTTGNDSPRGGRTGEYIAVKKAELAKIKGIHQLL